MTTIEPESFEEVAEALAAARADGDAVRIRGGGTKLGWGRAVPEPAIELRTGSLDRVLEHNPGDFTAIVQAGLPFASLQAELAEAGQMLALDPPLGDGDEATVGGVVATGDSGPLRHRYGAARDLVLGITVALADGTIARSGSKVIKNVAGYDLGKLFAGSLGTLGLILSVSLRLHPLPDTTATALGIAPDAAALARAALAVAAAPFELDSLDFAWREGRGGLLARTAGTEAPRRAARVAGLMGASGLEDVGVREDDGALWARQRAGQRSARHALVRAAGRPSALPALLRAVDAIGGTVVGRSALGIAYVELPAAAIATLRADLGADWRADVLDLPHGAGDGLDPWSTGDPGAVALMEQIKYRFDPERVCNPGIFVGSI